MDGCAAVNLRKYSTNLAGRVSFTHHTLLIFRWSPLPPKYTCFHFNKNPCSKNSFQTLRLCQWDKHNAFVLLVSKSQNIYENWVIVVINNDQKTWQNRSQKVMRVESGNKIQWGSWSAPLKNWLPEVLKTFWCFYVLFSCVNPLKRLKGGALQFSKTCTKLVCWLWIWESICHCQMRSDSFTVQTSISLYNVGKHAITLMRWPIHDSDDNTKMDKLIYHGGPQIIMSICWFKANHGAIWCGITIE